MPRLARPIPVDLVDLKSFTQRQCPGQPDECWPWQGHVASNGYGRFRIVGVSRVPFMAHRVAYVLRFGDVPSDAVIDHLCRNRSCVNPLHMEAVTNEENIARGRWHPIVNAAKTHCKHGHEFTPENTHIIPRTGERACRACNRRSTREYLQRKKAADDAGQ